jgi:hypothetical protein
MHSWQAQAYPRRTQVWLLQQHALCLARQNSSVASAAAACALFGVSNSVQLWVCDLTPGAASVACCSVVLLLHVYCCPVQASAVTQVLTAVLCTVICVVPFFAYMLFSYTEFCTGVLGSLVAWHC